MSNPLPADKMVSMSSEAFQEEEKLAMNSRMEQMQNNPTSNGGTFKNAPSSSGPSQSSGGSGMFGG